MHILDLKLKRSETYADHVAIAVGYHAHLTTSLGMERGVMLSVLPYSKHHLSEMGELGERVKAYIADGLFPTGRAAQVYFPECPEQEHMCLQRLPRANQGKTQAMWKAFVAVPFFQEIIVDYASGLTPKGELWRIPNKIGINV